MKWEHIFSKRSRYSAKEKLKILIKYENNHISIVELCRTYQINDTTFVHGKNDMDIMESKDKKSPISAKKYPKELEEAKVLHY